MEDLKRLAWEHECKDMNCKDSICQDRQKRLIAIFEIIRQSAIEETHDLYEDEE